MSYDLQVWSANPPDLAAVVPLTGSWSADSNGLKHVARAWQVVVATPDRVLPEDVPAEVADALAGIEYLTAVTVEPITAPSAARTLARRVAMLLAKASHGVVVDEQANTVITPSGVKRYVPSAREERFSVLEMSWWFAEGPLLRRAGLDALVEFISRRLPDALPRRYGLHQPPQHRLEETGMPHFLDFLAQHAESSIVWYPRRPVMSVTVHPRGRWGVHPNFGFECGYASVVFEFAALEQSGWAAALRRFWKEASRVIHPFYGDVRTLDGVVRMGGTYGGDMNTESGPVHGHRWRGIPRDPGHACVCGPGYLELWPDFRRVAHLEADLGFVDTPDWRARDCITSLTGPVPEAIAQRWTPTWRKIRGGSVMAWNTRYPPAWPFGPAPPTDPGEHHFES